MKHWRIGGEARIDLLEYTDALPRDPERDEVLVRVEASSLNFHDYLVATGVLKVEAGRIPLSDGVGVVEACGPEVRGLAPGDRVMGTFFPDWLDGPPLAARVGRMRGDQVDGFASTHVTMKESDFTRVPAGLSAVEAATLPCAGLTAWRAVIVEGKVKPGQTILVQGSGGVSVFALQFARMAGARVIATSSSEAKAERLIALGAEEVVDYGTQPKWGRTVRDLTDGGVDLLVEVAGGDLTQSLQSIRVGGQLCLVGALSRQPIQFLAGLGINGNRSICGITVGSREHQMEMVAAIEAHGLRPAVDTSFKLQALPEAFRRLESKQHFGKIVIDYS